MAKRSSKSSGTAGEGGPAGDGHLSRDERPDGWYMNDQGELCFGQTCMIMKVADDGLHFELDPATCDPDTRERLLAAAVEGPSSNFYKS